MPTRVSTAFLAVLIAVVSPRLANHGAALAQNLTGRVSDSLSGQTLSGAVVIVLDAKGAALLRRVTDELGRYRFDLPREAARIEVRRIGFRPARANVSPRRRTRWRGRPVGIHHLRSRPARLRQSSRVAATETLTGERMVIVRSGNGEG
jgi:hypothetical protein